MFLASVRCHLFQVRPQVFSARTLAFLCALVSAPVLAHEDSLVEIAADGSLRGLPVKYEPARLVHGAMFFRLRLGQHEVSLPLCLTSQLGLGKAKLKAYASWYHERSILPPYLGVDVVHGERQQGFFTGFSLLFNLETSSLIEVTRLSVEGHAQHRSTVNIRSLCDEKERVTMEPRRVSS
jgi:hypothetical protein